MKTIHKFAMGLALAGALGMSPAFAHQGTSNQRGWGQGRVSRIYNPNTVETIKGKVVKVETFAPGRGMRSGIHLLVRTESGTMPVVLGPSWFIENQKPQIEQNQEVEVTGSQVTLNGQKTLIAAEVKTNGRILRLRDESGRPVWAGWRRTGPGMYGGTMGQGMGPGMMQEGQGAMGQGMMGQGQGRMRPRMMHQGILEKLQSMDAKLEKKVDRMNEAEGKAKIQAMEDVINELVDQRKELAYYMASRRHQMMTYRHRMMGNYQEGMGGMGNSIQEQPEE